jgi:hypothetical protein
MSVHRRHSNFYWHFLYIGINTKIVACCRTFNYLIERADRWSNAINNLVNIAAIACPLDIWLLNTLFDIVLWRTSNWPTSRWSKQLPRMNLIFLRCWWSWVPPHWTLFLVDGDAYQSLTFTTWHVSFWLWFWCLLVATISREFWIYEYHDTNIFYSSSTFDTHYLPSLLSSNQIAQTTIIELQALTSKLPVPTQNNK